jgi:hypothetical protein
MLDRVRPLVQGVQVSAPFGKVELALEVFGDRLSAPASLASERPAVSSMGPTS